MRLYPHYLRYVTCCCSSLHRMLSVAADVHMPAGLPLPLPVACSSPLKPLPRSNLVLRCCLSHFLRAAQS